MRLLLISSSSHWPVSALIETVECLLWPAILKSPGFQQTVHVHKVLTLMSSSNLIKCNPGTSAFTYETAAAPSFNSQFNPLNTPVLLTDFYLQLKINSVLQYTMLMNNKHYYMEMQRPLVQSFRWLLIIRCVNTVYILSTVYQWRTMTIRVSSSQKYQNTTIKQRKRITLL